MYVTGVPVVREVRRGHQIPDMCMYMSHVCVCMREVRRGHRIPGSWRDRQL